MVEFVRSNALRPKEPLPEVLERPMTATVPSFDDVMTSEQPIVEAGEFLVVSINP